MEQKSQLKSSFLEAAYGTISALSLSCGVIGGTLVGINMALPSPSPVIVAGDAALVVLTSLLSGICAAGAWQIKHPEHPAENAKYAGSLVIGLALGAAILSGANSYWMTDNILNIIDKKSPPPATAQISAPTPEVFLPR